MANLLTLCFMAYMLTLTPLFSYSTRGCQTVLLLHSWSVVHRLLTRQSSPNSNAILECTDIRRLQIGHPR